MLATILVVDHEPELRSLTRAALEPEGYRILEADTADEALLVVKKAISEGDPVGLVLIDWVLPGRSGLDLQRDLLSRDPELRTVLITGFGTIETAIRSMKDGARDFLRKPFTADTLRQAVSNALTREERAAPVTTVRREFVRTNVNGYSFELDSTVLEGQAGDVRCVFTVHGPKGADPAAEHPDSDQAIEVVVVLPAYVQELAKALIDVETLPCGERFWTKMCEEELARYLWEHDAPLTREVRIEDVTRSQREWLESVTTVVNEPSVPKRVVSEPATV